MTPRPLSAILSAAVLLLMPSIADAQCDPVDFEGFAPGTIATNIVPGVTFSALPGSCGGPGSVLPIVVIPAGGTSSGTRAVSLETGCPDFSPDYLVMDFDEPQTDVEFTMGAQSGQSGLVFNVRWTDDGVDFARLFISGGSVGTLVRLAGIAITRVEIEESAGFFEAIDDLRFAVDDTPPIVEIDTPAFDACVCGDDLLAIIGTVADNDGNYACDELSYRPVNADPGDPWVTAGTACGAFVGTLYTLDTSSLAAGRWYLRIVGSNQCGLESSDVTVIRVDRGFGVAAITGFDGGREDGTLCGVVEVLGGIADDCGVAAWQLDIALPDQEPFATIDVGVGGRSCVITEFDTRFVEDGDYRLILTATDNCGHTAIDERDITVSNEGFCECTPDINGDGEVDFADILLVLANWT